MSVDQMLRDKKNVVTPAQHVERNIRAAALLYSQKLLNSNAYEKSSERVGAYSQAIAKVLMQYSAEDKSHCALLNAAIEEGFDRLCRIEHQRFCLPGTLDVMPVFFHNDEIDDEYPITEYTMQNLQDLRTIEGITVKTLQDADNFTTTQGHFAPQGSHNAGSLQNYVNLHLLINISKRRRAKLVNLIHKIETGSFFVREKPQKWFCMRCGAMHYDYDNSGKQYKTNVAFEQCYCCSSPQSFCSIEQE